MKLKREVKKVRRTRARRAVRVLTLEGAEGPALVIVGLAEAFGESGIGHVEARRGLVLGELQQVGDVDAALALGRRHLPSSAWPRVR